MRAFMLNTYDEYGPENICFATTPEAVQEKAMRHYPANPLEEDDNIEFQLLVTNPATKTNKAHDLSPGWGGWQLTILDDAPQA